MKSIINCIPAALGSALLLPALVFAQTPHAAGVEPLAIDATPAQMQAAAANVRAGKRLLPKQWPKGARVAVCITFDIDNETVWRQNPLPVPMSEGEYGALQALPRILALLDRYEIPASFYIPAMSAELHPQMIPAIRKSGRNEIGIHGWVHEEPSTVGDSVKEEQALNAAIAYLTQAVGKRPVGYRAPSWDYSPYTLDLVRKAGFLYDSSMMAMDDPYELVSKGKPTGLIELPVSYILDDWPYYEPDATGSLPAPEAVYQVFKGEFDGAYAERGVFILTMHPHVTGRRSRIQGFDRLLAYIKSKNDVWFATLEQVANYVKQQSGR